MSVEIGINLWTCDDCGRRVEAMDGGFPAGWIWVAEKALTTHRCHVCAERVPPKQRRQPRERATNVREYGQAGALDQNQKGLG